MGVEGSRARPKQSFALQAVACFAVEDCLGLIFGCAIDLPGGQALTIGGHAVDQNIA